MVIANCFVWSWLVGSVESVTFTVKTYCCGYVAAPSRAGTPADLAIIRIQCKRPEAIRRELPPGSAPVFGTSAHVIGVTPPFVEMELLYAAFRNPEASGEVARMESTGAGLMEI